MTHGNAPPPPPPYSVTFYNSGSDICPVVGVEPMVSNSSALLSTPSALEIANADYAFKKSSLWNRKGYFSSTKSVSSSSKTFHSNGHGGRYRTSFQNPDCELVVQKRIDRDRRFDRPVVKNSTPNVHHSFNKGLALVTPLCSSSSVYDMSSKGIKYGN